MLWRCPTCRAWVTDEIGRACEGCRAMDRATRDKFASGTQADITGGNACWQTAPKVFEKLNEDFGPFDIDLTADASNHLVDVWFGPGSWFSEDALAAVWSDYGLRGYSNPPYGPFISRILPKARDEAAKGFLSALLLPLRVTKAFRAHILRGASRVLLCDRRLIFFEDGLPRCSYDKRGRVETHTALFDSVVVVYEPGYTPRNPAFSEWLVPTHISKDDLDRWAALHPYEEWLQQHPPKAA